jgi:excisionase family DNA binding protein
MLRGTPNCLCLSLRRSNGRYIVGELRIAASRRTLMNIEEVAERLGVSVRHVRRLVAERRIPFIKWGHLVRFDPSEVDHWIEERAVPATADSR